METKRVELKDGTALVVKPRVAVEITTREDDNGPQIIALVSTPSVDSYGDIIRQGPNENGKGWLLDRFNKAPVMLWGHDISLPSIGGGKAYVGPHAVHKEGLYLEPAFDMPDPMAATVAGKVERGVVTETSVGFVSRVDGKREDAGPFGGYEFYEQELLEISWVNRGANPDTAVMFKSMIGGNPELAGLINPDQFEGKAIAALQKDLIEMRAEFEARLTGLADKLDNPAEVFSDFARMDAVTNRLARALSSLTTEG